MPSNYRLCLMGVMVLSMHCLAGIPVIYSTDLFHPFDDPDDHYDLATLFALPELDVKAVIIDRSNIHEQRTYQSFPKEPGIVALQQMSFLSGRKVPIALGLTRPLSSAEDTAKDQPESSLQGVRLILSVLRHSKEKVALFAVGSLVDVAAAYNRDPQLLHRKVSKIYVNAGTGPDGIQEEWNVRLDPFAYSRMMLSGLHIEWYPCFGRDQYFTHFVVDQPSVLGACDDSLRAFFAYAFQHSKKEPISFLSGIYPPPQGPRNMWCTAAFIDLSGRRIYATPKGFEALPEPPTSNARPVSCYEMCPVTLTLAEADQSVKKTQSGLYGLYEGQSQDLIGTHGFDRDGKLDCLVSIHGLRGDETIGKTITRAALFGTREGKWVSEGNSELWRLGVQWHGNRLQVFFSFWSQGLHRLELNFEDGSKETLTFNVPAPNLPCFQADLDVTQSTIHVLRKQEPDYTKILTSCMTQILNAYPLAGPVSQDAGPLE